MCFEMPSKLLWGDMGFLSVCNSILRTIRLNQSNLLFFVIRVMNLNCNMKSDVSGSLVLIILKCVSIARVIPNLWFRCFSLFIQSNVLLYIMNLCLVCYNYLIHANYMVNWFYIFLFNKRLLDVSSMFPYNA